MEAHNATAELAAFEHGTAASVQSGTLGDGICIDANAFSTVDHAVVETVIHFSGHSETITHCSVSN